MAFNKHSLADRLKNQTVIDGECLIFQGCKDAKGYGQIRVNGKWEKAHRKAYELAKGKIAADMVIMHTCDKPACINPNHLIAATQQQNIADMKAKGRSNKPTGEKNPRAKLNSAQILEIRKRFIRYDRQHGATQLAREYSVSKTVILQIISGRLWGHILESDSE